MKKRFVTLLTVLCLLVSLAGPVYAAGNTYIFDDEGLLMPDAALRLEQQCALAAEQYGCGIYVVTLSDFTSYGFDARTAAEEIYRGSDFGVGENKNGIMLMLSMAERDYALICYGDIANSVFTDHMQARIAEGFLDDLSVDDWEGGLTDYVENSIYALESFNGTVGESYEGYYEESVYYPETAGSRLGYVLSGFGWAIMLISVIIALVACLIMKNGMKTAKIATYAGEYIPKGGVNLQVRQDVFTHTTRQVIHHERNHSSGGGGGRTSVGGGGFSGRSGKF